MHDELYFTTLVYVTVYLVLPEKKNKLGFIQ